MANPKGSNWAQAQDFAKKGKFGKAKPAGRAWRWYVVQGYAQESEIWDPNADRGTPSGWSTFSSGAEASRPSVIVDALVMKMQQQQADQQASYPTAAESVCGAAEDSYRRTRAHEA